MPIPESLIKQRNLLLIISLTFISFQAICDRITMEKTGMEYNAIDWIHYQLREKHIPLLFFITTAIDIGPYWISALVEKRK